ncbi:ribonuclease Z [Candidatus Bathyarchaeota archaeon]|nr:ribonuclease Z [Candidatus Bathyarchaeota archaeon]
MKVVFLGTSGSMPTAERSSSSTVIKIGRDLVMFDCGEGTQRQMVKARVGFRRDMIILISHLHGDHILGIPGLLQTMSLLGRERQLEIFGPVGLVDYIRSFSETLGGPSFPVIIYEIQESGKIHEEDRFKIIAVPVEHRLAGWSYGFIEEPRPGRFYPEKARELGVPEGPLWHKLQHGESVEINGSTVNSSQVTDPSRPGRKIVYSGDTRPTNDVRNLSDRADLLIHEATFMDELRDRAIEDGHTTVKEAAELAREAGVKKLALTHISSRYPDSEPLLNEARSVFKRTIIAEDLMEIEIPIPR